MIPNINVGHWGSNSREGNIYIANKL